MDEDNLALEGPWVFEGIKDYFDIWKMLLSMKFWMLIGLNFTKNIWESTAQEVAWMCFSECQV